MNGAEQEPPQALCHHQHPFLWGCLWCGAGDVKLPQRNGEWSWPKCPQRGGIGGSGMPFRVSVPQTAGVCGASRDKGARRPCTSLASPRYAFRRWGQARGLFSGGVATHRGPNTGGDACSIRHFQACGCADVQCKAGRSARYVVAMGTIVKWPQTARSPWPQRLVPESMKSSGRARFNAFHSGQQPALVTVRVPH